MLLLLRGNSPFGQCLFRQIILTNLFISGKETKENIMYTLTPTYDTFSDVLPGDPWQPEPAARYNAVNELLRQESFMTPSLPVGAAGNLCCANVLNISDKIINFNKAVQIETEQPTTQNPIDLSETYICGKPLEDEESFWGVALETIPPGGAGMVQLSGVVCLRHIIGDYLIPDPADDTKILAYQNFVRPRSDGIYEVSNRGRARILWYQKNRTAAIALLNSPSLSYDGMFSVRENGDMENTLTVKGGITDLPVTLGGDDKESETLRLEDTIVKIDAFGYARRTICLTATRTDSNHIPWELGIEISHYRNGRDLYRPGERMVWPLASYNGATGLAPSSPKNLVQLQYGPVNFRERYYVDYE